MEHTDLRVICIGNLLHGNDGVGHAVFARLNKMGLPASVELLDGGIGGLALLPHFKGVPRLLIIDLMKSDMQAGSISFFEDILPQLPVDTESSGEHGGDLTTLLSMLPVYLDSVPNVDLLCVSAREVSFYETSLEYPVAQAIDDVCACVEHYVDEKLSESHLKH